MNEPLAEAIAFAKQAGPEVWAMALRQVYVDTMLCVVYVLAYLASVRPLWEWARRTEQEVALRRSNCSYPSISIVEDIGPFFVTMCLLVGALVAGFAVVVVVQVLINPEWATIQKIMGLMEV